MEPNLPIIPEKVWNIVRTMFHMLRKGISKGKLMAELNKMFKRWKIAGKAIQNLMFHHAHHWSATTSRRSSPLDLPNGFEFSCSKSPAYPNLKLPFHLNKRKHNLRLFSPSPEEDFINMTAVEKTLEVFYSAVASPAFLGFGKSSIVRQLRVTDSPFPLRNADDDNHVDEAAEEFIMKFHNDLRRQIEIASPLQGS